MCLPSSCTPLFLAPYIFHTPVTQATCPCITLNAGFSPVICFGIENKIVFHFLPKDLPLIVSACLSYGKPDFAEAMRDCTRQRSQTVELRCQGEEDDKKC